MLSCIHDEDPWRQQTISLKQASVLCALQNAIVLSPAKLPSLSPCGKLPSGLSNLCSAVKCLQEKLAKYNFFLILHIPYLS